jgi:hypothetical protein
MSGGLRFITQRVQFSHHVEVHVLGGGVAVPMAHPPYGGVNWPSEKTFSRGYCRPSPFHLAKASLFHLGSPESIRGHGMNLCSPQHIPAAVSLAVVPQN